MWKRLIPWRHAIDSAAALSASFLLSLGLLAGCSGDDDRLLQTPVHGDGRCHHGAGGGAEGPQVHGGGAVKASAAQSEWKAFVDHREPLGTGAFYKAANKGNGPVTVYSARTVTSPALAS